MKRKLFLFISGGLCFIASQPLLRIPILNYIEGKTRFILLYGLNPILIGILIAFSAGIFEEGFRFLFRKYLIKEPKFGIIEPIIFGLGHGLTEAFIVLGPYLFTYPLSQLYIGIIERGLAIILHIGLTIIIWNGFELSKKYRYLIIAVGLHGFVNSLIPIIGFSNVLLIEGALGLVDILIILYAFKSKKYYVEEEII